jgi:hypothetical protein
MSDKKNRNNRRNHDEDFHRMRQEDSRFQEKNRQKEGYKRSKNKNWNNHQEDYDLE